MIAVIESELEAARQFGVGIKDAEAKRLLAYVYVSDLAGAVTEDKRVKLAGVVYEEAGIIVSMDEIRAETLKPLAWA